MHGADKDLIAGDQRATHSVVYSVNCADNGSGITNTRRGLAQGAIRVFGNGNANISGISWIIFGVLSRQIRHTIPITIRFFTDVLNQINTGLNKITASIKLNQISPNRDAVFKIIHAAPQIDIPFGGDRQLAVKVADITTNFNTRCAGILHSNGWIR